VELVIVRAERERRSGAKIKKNADGEDPIVEMGGRLICKHKFLFAILT